MKHLHSTRSHLAVLFKKPRPLHARGSKCSLKEMRERRALRHLRSLSPIDLKVADLEEKWKQMKQGAGRGQPEPQDNDNLTALAQTANNILKQFKQTASCRVSRHPSFSGLQNEPSPLQSHHPTRRSLVGKGRWKQPRTVLASNS